MLRPLLYVLGTLLVTQAAVIATSVYLHRGLAHRALRLHPIADWIFQNPCTSGLWGSFSVSVKAWCLRWTATHSRRFCPVVNQRTNRKPQSASGWSRSARWASPRCRYTEVAMTAAWVTASVART